MSVHELVEVPSGRVVGVRAEDVVAAFHCSAHTRTLVVRAGAADCPYELRRVALNAEYRALDEARPDEEGAGVVHALFESLAALRDVGRRRHAEAQHSFVQLSEDLRTRALGEELRTLATRVEALEVRLPPPSAHVVAPSEESLAQLRAGHEALRHVLEDHPALLRAISVQFEGGLPERGHIRGLIPDRVVVVEHDLVEVEGLEPPLTTGRAIAALLTSAQKNGADTSPGAWT